MQKFYNQLINLSRPIKIILILIVDVVCVSISSYLAQVIMLGYLPPVSKVLILYIFIASSFLVLICYISNAYQYIYRFFALRESVSLFITTNFVILLLYLIGLFFELNFFKLNYIIFQNLFFFIFANGWRVFFKYLNATRSQKNNNLANCVIFGAGNDGLLMYKKLSYENKFNVIAFFDEDKNKVGRYLEGKKIYSLIDLKKIILKYNIKNYFYCSPTLTSFNKKEIETIFLKEGLKLEGSNKKFLSINKFSPKVSKLGDITNEISLKKKYFNKVIFITGAAGSIGQELCFQLYQYKPKKIIAIDNSEYNISTLTRLTKKYDVKKFQIKLLNICDKKELKILFDKEKPEIVFHAAAYKHVDIVENNPFEAVKNNIFSVLNVLNLSAKLNVENFVFISTDKAVNPINIMGLTKKCGEILTTYFASSLSEDKNFFSVRFGNVIGSSGSFIQILNQQISQGGPITLTDKKATRYFMTLSDAVNLVIKSNFLEGNGDTFVLKMDNPVNIYDLAIETLKENNLTVLNSKNPDGDIEIKYTGLRPGEKMHEELFQTQSVYKTSNDLIMVEKNNNNISQKNLKDFVTGLNKANKKKDLLMLKKILNTFITCEN
jgi:FlaA1/EpsC-like NDP-sugar epimerase